MASLGVRNKRQVRLLSDEMKSRPLHLKEPVPGFPGMHALLLSVKPLVGTRQRDVNYSNRYPLTRQMTSDLIELKQFSFLHCKNMWRQIGSNLPGSRYGSKEITMLPSVPWLFVIRLEKEVVW